MRYTAMVESMEVQVGLSSVQVSIASFAWVTKCIKHDALLYIVTTMMITMMTK